MLEQDCFAKIVLQRCSARSLREGATSTSLNEIQYHKSPQPDSRAWLDGLTLCSVQKAETAYVLCK